MHLLIKMAEDQWLCNLLSRPSYNLQLSDAGSSLTALLSNELSSPEVFATLKIPTSNFYASARIQRLGFIHVDTSLIFEGFIEKISLNDCLVRPAIEQDEGPVIKIAEKAFSYSRFHSDPYISDKQADKIKGSWAGNYFRGERGDGMLVAIINNTIVGFLQFFVNLQDCLVIDLIGVSPDAVGQGIGSKMLEYASTQSTTADKPILIKVGTQACNTASVNFYSAAGLNLISSQNIFHFHGKFLS